MENISQVIKDKRLFLNLRMDDLAKKVGTTRATISSIEHGKTNCSMETILKIFDVLDISLNIDSHISTFARERASRLNTVLTKKINRFVIMCVEQYASYINKSSRLVYKRMFKCGIIDELVNDYEDLHGMSTMYLNDHIHSLMENRK